MLVDEKLKLASYLALSSYIINYSVSKINSLIYCLLMISTTNLIDSMGEVVMIVRMRNEFILRTTFSVGDSGSFFESVVPAHSKF